MDEFANKNDLDRVNKKIENLVSSDEFGIFLKEFNELKSSMISSEEMLYLRADVKDLKKNVTGSLQKSDYFERTTIIINDMKKGFKERPKKVELQNFEAKVT